MYRHARSDDCQKDDKDFVTRGSSTTPDTMIIYTKNIFIAGPNLFIWNRGAWSVLFILFG